MSHLRNNSAVGRGIRVREKCTEYIKLDLNDDIVHAVKYIGNKIIHCDDKLDSRSYVACYNALVLLSRRISTSSLTSTKGNLVKAALLMVRCGLWSEVKEIRCAALRCIRYLLHSKDDVHVMLQLHLDYFIGRSLDLSYDESGRVTFRHMDENERVQVMRCVWHICQLAPDLVLTSAPSILRPIVDELIALGSMAPSTSITTANPLAAVSVIQQGQMQVFHHPGDSLHAGIANTKDQSIHCMVLLLCQLMILCPKECTGLGFDRALLNALLFNLSGSTSPLHARRLCEAITLSLLRTLDTHCGRLCIPRGQIEKLLTPVTRLSFEQASANKKSSSSGNTEYGFDQLKVAKFSIILTLRTWPGFLYFCQPESDAIFSINQLLHVGHTETRREILDLLFDLFLFPKPPCLGKRSSCGVASKHGTTQQGPQYDPHIRKEDMPDIWSHVFDSILHQITHSSVYYGEDGTAPEFHSSSSTSVTHHSTKWSLAKDFVVREALTLLPYRSETRPDLVENHIALLVALFIEKDILEALVAALSDPDGGLAVAATVLLGCLIHTASTLLPNEHPAAQRADTMSLLGDSRIHQAVQRIERLHKALQADCHRCYSPFLHYLCLQSSNSNLSSSSGGSGSVGLSKTGSLHSAGSGVMAGGVAGGTLAKGMGSLGNPSFANMSPAAYASPGTIVRSPSNFSPLISDAETFISTPPTHSRKSVKTLELLLEQLIQESNILQYKTVNIGTPIPATCNAPATSHRSQPLNPMTSFSGHSFSSSTSTNTIIGSTSATIVGVDPLLWDWDLIVCFMKRLTGSNGLQVTWEENAQMTKLLHTLMDFFTPPSAFSSGNNIALSLPRSIQTVDLRNAHRNSNAMPTSHVHSSFSNGTVKGRSSTTSTSASTGKAHQNPYQVTSGQPSVFLTPVFCQQKMDWSGAQRAAHTLVELLQHLTTFPQQTEGGRLCREFLSRFYDCLSGVVKEANEWQQQRTSYRSDSDANGTICGDNTFDSSSNLTRAPTQTTNTSIGAFSNVSRNTGDCASFCSDYLQRFPCLQYLFLAVGRLTCTEKGEDMLDQAGITQAWRDIFMLGMEETLCIVKLVLSSLDYTRRGQARSLLRMATTSSCESIRIYAAQFLRILFRARVPYYSSWCMDMLLNFLQDPSPHVVACVMDSLQEACEDEVNVAQLHPYATTVVHLGYPGMLLFTRLMGNEAHFVKLKDMNVLNYLMDMWMQDYGEEYVRQIEYGTLSCYWSHFTEDLIQTLVDNRQRRKSNSSQWVADFGLARGDENENLESPASNVQSSPKLVSNGSVFSRHSYISTTTTTSTSPTLRYSVAPVEELNSTVTADSNKTNDQDMNTVRWLATSMSNCGSGGRPSFILPSHPFAALAQHKEGMQWLRKREDLETCLTIVQKKDACETEPQRLKSALWCLGHVCSTMYGLEWAEERDVVSILCKLAANSPTLSVRGTAIFCVSLIATTPRGVEQLSKWDWLSTRTTRLNKWPLMLHKQVNIPPERTHSDMGTTGAVSANEPSSPLFHLSESQVSPFSSSQSSSTPGDTLSTEEADALKRLSKLLDEIDSSQEDRGMTSSVNHHDSITSLSNRNEFCSQVERARHESLSPSLSKYCEPSSSFTKHRNEFNFPTTPSPVRSLGRKWTTSLTSSTVCRLHAASSTGALPGSQITTQQIMPLSPQDVRGYAELNRLNNLLWERQLMDDKTTVPTAQRSYTNFYNTSSLGRKVSTYTSAVMPIAVTRYRGLAVPCSVQMLGTKLYSEIHPDTHSPTLPCSTYHCSASRNQLHISINKSNCLLLHDGDLLSDSSSSSVGDQGGTVDYSDPSQPAARHDNDVTLPSHSHFNTVADSDTGNKPSVEEMALRTFIYHTPDTCLSQKCSGNSASERVTELRYYVISAVQQLLMGRNTRKMEEILLSVRDSQSAVLEDICLISEIACRLHDFKCCSRNSRTFVHEIFYGMRPTSLYDDVSDILTEFPP